MRFVDRDIRAKASGAVAESTRRKRERTDPFEERRERRRREANRELRAALDEAHFETLQAAAAGEAEPGPLAWELFGGRLMDIDDVREQARKLAQQELDRRVERRPRRAPR